MFNLVALIVTILYIIWNHQALIGALGAQREIQRLKSQRYDLLHTNPPDFTEDFKSLGSGRWLTIINGAGQVGHFPAWHTTALHLLNESKEGLDSGLRIVQHPDPDYEYEDANLFRQPAAGRYNNGALVGMQGYMPTPAADVILTCGMQASPDFYGTAGCVFQPMDTLDEQGVFRQTFDMFGVALVGPESALQGLNGAVCNFSAAWWPVETKPLNVDLHSPAVYKLRLRWISATEWEGTVWVNGQEQCRMSLPPLGPLEVQLWSDNYLIKSLPWYRLNAPEVAFQDGGEKEFHITGVSIWTEDLDGAQDAAR